MIIPAYNAGDTLGEQLDALNQQTFEGDWEIIVVNNASTDDTVEVVEAYQRHIPHLRLVHALERRSRSYARNTGTRAARGDAFLFCDADDVVSPVWVAALAQALQDHSHVAGALEFKTPVEPNSWQLPASECSKKPALGFLPFAPTGNLAVSRKAFEAVRGFSEDFRVGEDVNFSWRLQLQGYDLRYVPAAVIYYRYPGTFLGLWKKWSSYAEAHVLLYKHFAAHGMPRTSLRAIVKKYWKLTRQILWLPRANQQQRSNWIRKTAACWGRLRGSLRYRTLYL